MGWGWVAKSEARQLATAALWVRIRHTLARQKNIQKKTVWPHTTVWALDSPRLPLHKTTY
jgi:hypothetical protein